MERGYRSGANWAGAATWVWAGALWVCGTAIIGVVCTLLVRQGCLHPGPPVTVPDPSTPRAGLCSAVNGDAPWLLVTVVPCAVVGIASILLRSYPRLMAFGVLVVWLALIAVTGLASSLSYSVTI